MTEKTKRPVKGRHLLTDKDFVDVVDSDGKSLPPVPKHWTEADLVPGSKFAKGKKSGKPGGGSGGGSQRKPGEEPAGNASRDDWAAYATEKGAVEDETKPIDEGGLSRDDLRAKYGSST